MFVGWGAQCFSWIWLWVGAFGYCSYELLGNMGDVLFEGLFSDGFASGDFLVDVIVGDCGVGFMGICDGLGGGHVLVWCVIE